MQIEHNFDWHICAVLLCNLEARMIGILCGSDSMKIFLAKTLQLLAEEVCKAKATESQRVTIRLVSSQYPNVKQV
jgi:hypothetical protein